MIRLEKNSDISKLTSPSSLTSMTSRESSQSPPNNQLQAGNHAAHLLQLNNNIALNDQNLKFSIDNILKADFGRRITDPLKRSGKSYAKKPSAEKPTTSAAPAAMDLTSVMTSAAGCSGTNSSGPSRSFNSSSSSASGSEVDVPASPQSSTGSSKTGEGTSGSTTTSGSGGPMVWPAWVYCTRYSDRPSSGEWRPAFC
ncbi:homeobox protein invected-like [Culex pipiens pallens]|uniref:homeobox protein invected-like n=1 Tax=Culex pipiens pallens TaxID=42434 RepID=UPI001954B34F|nr:homeobox protein invected-like [Culex pipiens pallens]